MLGGCACLALAGPPGLPAWVEMRLGREEACVSEAVAGSPHVHPPDAQAELRFPLC